MSIILNYNLILVADVFVRPVPPTAGKLSRHFLIYK
nr:MAG TPA: hypothetical protein [Caudoviricetes sp.]